MNQHEVPCPVCGSSHYDVLYRPWRAVTDPIKLFGAASGERGTQQIVRCRTPDCGMVYVSPRYDNAVILAGYQNTEDQGHDTQFDSRVKTFLRSLQKHRQGLHPPGSRSLGVGCAGGAFVKAADLFGYQATGLEPSTYLAACARERGLPAECGTLDSYRPSEPLDRISLSGVL